MLSDFCPTKAQWLLLPSNKILWSCSASCSLQLSSMMWCEWGLELRKTFLYIFSLMFLDEIPPATNESVIFCFKNPKSSSFLSFKRNFHDWGRAVEICFRWKTHRARGRMRNLIILLTSISLKLLQLERKLYCVIAVLESTQIICSPNFMKPPRMW